MTQEELRELNEIWKLVMESFRDAMSESTIDLWFTPLILESYENGTITFRNQEGK